MKRLSLYDLIVYFIIAFVIISQAYSIFIVQKPFWLDEWFIVGNIKAAPYSHVFSSLNYNQEFPRIYLAIIKFFASQFNFSGPSLRLIPFVIAIIATLFSYFLAKNYLYKNNHQAALLFLLFLICNYTLANYFIFTKQYTMEIFCALLGAWQYYQARQTAITLSLKQKSQFISWAIFFIAPFFSYNYPIIASPIIGLFALTWLFSKKTTQSFLCFITPIFLFCLALVIAFIIDLHFIFADTQMKACWHPYFVDYSSFNHFLLHTANLWHFFLGNVVFLFLTHPVKQQWLQFIFNSIPWILSIVTCIGIILSIIEIIKTKSFFTLSARSTIQQYFILLLIASFSLYLLNMLPIQGERLNAYSAPMVIFFFLQAVFWLSRFIYLRLLPILVIIFSLFLTVIIYSQGFLMHSRWYDSQAYRNYGQAILTAQKLNLPIAVLTDAAPYHWKLIIQTHPEYDIRRKLPVYEVALAHDDDTPALCNITNIPATRKFIAISRYSYTIQSYAEICNLKKQ